ncbi:MAG: precorrin-3B C(17)-methyltransferase, partial [Gammaproteobacteria bacterium]|nr:precorrin-3B C(17)-methyltransferase [Gammaproteobacteria bacterium]
SGRRTQQIVEAQRILLQYRDPKTPVAIVKSAYRDLQDIQMVTLDKMSDCKIGMLTTVLIGNSSTYMQEGLMITPRGYANKYESLTGETLEGEKRGRSLSMGLIGWQACVREYIRASDNPTIRNIIVHFGMPAKHVFDAIAQGTDEDKAGDYSATALAPNKLGSIIESAKSWGKLRGVIRSEAGAVSELMLNAADFSLRGTWLNIENDYFHAHIDWSKVTSASFVKGGDRLKGIHFFDKHDDTIFNLSLVRADGVFDSEAVDAFNKTWIESGVATEVE